MTESPFGIQLNVEDELLEHHPFLTAKGKMVYDRTYSRTKPDGSRENWYDTVHRVARGNLAFVHGDDMNEWSKDAKDEYDELVAMMSEFKLMPAGRHLWATGVPGRQFVSNCFVSHWTPKLSEHFTFTLLRLAEGGGVGSNYSTKYTGQYPEVKRNLKVHIVCDPSHPNYQDMKDAGLLSDEYSHEWTGSFQIEDSREGWADGMADLLDTYVKEAPVKHQSRVYDVSLLRKKGAPLRTMGGVASGPEPFAQMLHNISAIMNRRFERKLRSVDFMEIDHEIGACVVAGGNRRSARMSILRWDDPYIMDFIKCKQDPSKHWTTNISVEIDDEFINYVQHDEYTTMEVHEMRGEDVRRYAKAHRVYKAIITGMLTNGEPGMWNSSLSNEGELNEVVSTNPCGEITLNPWESCILGHVNMDAFAPPVGFENWPLRDKLGHWDELYRAHRLMARFLVRATYGTMNDEKQAAVVSKNRRIGVGHMGVQGFLVKQGTAMSGLNFYDEEHWFNRLLASLHEEVRGAVREIAFELRIPESIKTTTIAPTGTTSKVAGVDGEGIHPIYAVYFEQRIRFSTVDPKEVRQFEDLKAKGYEWEVAKNEKDTVIIVIPTKDKLVEEVEKRGLPAELVESADMLSVRQLLAVQAVYQRYYADNAVSFTANVPATEEQNAYFLENPYGSTPPVPSNERIREVGLQVREMLPHLKGTTIMVDGTRPQAPYTRLTREEFEALTGPTAVDEGIDEECATGACPVK